MSSKASSVAATALVSPSARTPISAMRAPERERVGDGDHLHRAGVDQALHPLAHRGLRQPDRRRQPGVGQPAVVLQLLDDGPVGVVQALVDPPHRRAASRVSAHRHGLSRRMAVVGKDSAPSLPVRRFPSPGWPTVAAEQRASGPADDPPRADPRALASPLHHAKYQPPSGRHPPARSRSLPRGPRSGWRRRWSPGAGTSSRPRRRRGWSGPPPATRAAWPSVARPRAGPRLGAAAVRRDRGLHPPGRRRPPVDLRQGRLRRAGRRAGARPWRSAGMRGLGTLRPGRASGSRRRPQPARRQRHGPRRRRHHRVAAAPAAAVRLPRHRRAQPGAGRWRARTTCSRPTATSTRCPARISWCWRWP